ncbi:LCP family protein [Phytoactinopolyspora mesophila]|nr:LCP family protein [Phytoactinopolyspora mesophila]
MSPQDRPRRPPSGDAGSKLRPGGSGYARFLRRAVLGVLIPGVGLIAAGRRRIGYVILGGFLLGLAVVGFYMWRAGQVRLARLGADADRVNLIGYGLLGVAAVWLLIAVVSFYLLEPPRLHVAQRLLAVVIVIAVAAAVVTPMGIGSHYAFTQRDFIQSVFPDEEERHSLTIPPAATNEDPWAGEQRVNVLLLGSDGGADRDGVRADTIMVASVDTVSGDTALFSIPRNLQHTPFPEGPLRDVYPDGYRGAPEAEFWVSSIYNNIPAEFPEYFEDIDNPGAEATKLAVGEALGLNIDYYVMVNLDGFQALVNALGGVVIDVPYPIPMGTQATSWGTCTPARDWIDEGEQQHLTGGQALWFARARCGPPPVSDDYERMRRQRCLLGAIAEQTNPFTLLTRYLHLESAVRDNIKTDIGRQRLEDFAELALRVQEAEIRSLPFTNEIIQYHSPDFDLIREFVQESLEADATEPSPTEAPAEDRLPADETDHDAIVDITGDPDGDAQGVDPLHDHTNGDTDAPDDADGHDGTDEIDDSVGAQPIDEVC